MAKVKLGARYGKNSSWTDYARVLEAGDDFITAGNLRGGAHPGGVSGWNVGRLPNEWHESAGRADYVVWSHATPIAWRIPNEGWVIPDVKYSVTTTIYQNKIRTAVGSFCPDYRTAIGA